MLTGVAETEQEDEREDERPRAYRVAELAEAAGVSVRTVRFYRERRLLQPPRKEGRIAWYGEEHLARLRLIAELLERGVAQGYVTVHPDGITHVSRRLMDATVALVGEGVPLAAVLDVSRRAAEYADA